MKDVFAFDVSMMKEIAKDTHILLRENQRDLRNMEMYSVQGSQWREQIRELEKICRRYEFLTYSLSAVANIYGSAESEAVDIAAF